MLTEVTLKLHDAPISSQQHHQSIATIQPIESIRSLLDLSGPVLNVAPQLL